MKIDVVESTTQLQRIAPHTHINGLGLSDDGSCEKLHNNGSERSGMVGQEKAREAAGLILQLIKERKMAGKAMLLTGPPSTGKTAIALAIAQELGENIPACLMVASEVYSNEVKKTEILTQNVRRAIGVRIKEKKEVYEGEVISLEEDESNVTSSTKYLTLRTKADEKKLKIAKEINEKFEKNSIKIGDVIYIETSTSNVIKVGRSDSFEKEFDLEVEHYVSLPSGNVHKKKEIVQNLTLNDLDLANASPNSKMGDILGSNNEGGANLQGILQSLMGGKTKRTEITEKLRNEVNKVITRMINQGIAELQPGILFIDEVHMLDVECFGFLNRVLESELSPTLIFATNRGHCHIRGTDGVTSPHGLPSDLIDRLFIVKTLPYNYEEIYQIINVRATTEEIELSDEAIQTLATIGTTTSLRFALQLIAPATYLQEAINIDEHNKSKNKNNCLYKLEEQSIKQVQTLFQHASISAKRLSNDNRFIMI